MQMYSRYVTNTSAVLNGVGAYNPTRPASALYYAGNAGTFCVNTTHRPTQIEQNSLRQ